MRIAFSLTIAVLFCNVALATEVEPGRLFYSPEERSRLETQRQDAERVDPVESSGSVTSTVRLRGMVTRTDGRTFLWLDGMRVRPKRHADMTGAESRLRARVGRAVALRLTSRSSPTAAGPAPEGGSAR